MAIGATVNFRWKRGKGENRIFLWTEWRNSSMMFEVTINSKTTNDWNIKIYGKKEKKWKACPYILQKIILNPQAS